MCTYNRYLMHNLFADVMSHPAYMYVTTKVHLMGICVVSKLIDHITMI